MRPVGVEVRGAVKPAHGAPAVVAAAAGIAGTYVYTEGRLESVEEAPLDRVYEASRQALADMEYPIREASKDALEAHLEAEQADETPVYVSMERKSDNSTELRIRLGVVGDGEVSQMILSRIREHL